MPAVRRNWRFRRRGASLAEMVLLLAVLGALFSAASQVVAGLMERQAVQRTAGQLSRLADDVGEWAEVDFVELLPRLAATEGRVEELTWVDMISAGNVSQPDVPTTPLRQTVRVFVHAPNERDLFVVLLTDSPEGGGARSVPRPRSNAAMVGRVDFHSPRELRGWEFTHDIGAIIDATGDEFEGELGAIRHVSDELHVSPFLHRFAVPGRPELNRMEAPLDMNGNAITGIIDLEAEDLELGGDLSVEGTLEAETVEVDRDLSVTGILATGRLEASEIDAVTVFSRTLITESAVIGTASTANLVVSGEADVTTLVVGDEMLVDSLNLGDVTMEHAEFTGSLRVPTLVTDRLETESCTGC